MRYAAEQKTETRARLLAAVGRAFRRAGFGGVGVDALAKEAGMTSGAFYGHFKSKEAAFEAAAVQGLEELRDAVLAMQADGDDWLERFMAFYLSVRLFGPVEESCGLQSLTADVTRASPAIKAQYQMALDQVIGAMAVGLGDRGKAVGLLALLSGGVTLARSVADGDVQRDMAKALMDQVRALAAA
jgi:TetR/AcrR family transcriptional repressor of nem operon